MRATTGDAAGDRLKCPKWWLEDKITVCWRTRAREIDTRAPMKPRPNRNQAPPQKMAARTPMGPCRRKEVERQSRTKESFRVSVLGKKRGAAPSNTGDEFGGGSSVGRTLWTTQLVPMHEVDW